MRILTVVIGAETRAQPLRLISVASLKEFVLSRWTSVGLGQLCGSVAFCPGPGISPNKRPLVSISKQGCLLERQWLLDWSDWNLVELVALLPYRREFILKEYRQLGLMDAFTLCGFYLRVRVRPLGSK